jgi:hypothetical protein
MLQQCTLQAFIQTEFPRPAQLRHLCTPHSRFVERILQFGYGLMTAFVNSAAVKRYGAKTSSQCKRKLRFGR